MPPEDPGQRPTLDSGKREQWDTGSRRDTRQGKGRYDLIAAWALRPDRTAA